MATASAMNKWMDYKFGMFIHYGLYSIIGEGEWVMFSKPIDRNDYAAYAARFTAEKFDAKHLVSLAQKAGMKYMVLTARHHDGFCLFDSKHSIGEFTIAYTPAAGRDLISEYTDACHEAGMGTGIYYSPMDWRCEGFFFPQMYHRSAMQMRTQCHTQIRELMSNYGKIDVLWYDGGEDHWLAQGMHLNEPDRFPSDFVKKPLIPGFWGEEELNKFVRELQPEIVVNNRLGMRKTGDYGTPERKVGEFNPHTPWETCDTLSESWGWMPDREVRSLENVIHLLTDVITGGGNLLLNVSPMGDGSLEPLHEQRLLEIGEWTSKYADSIYGTRGGPIINNKEIGGAVCKDNKIFFHIKNKECVKFRLPLPDVNAVSLRALTGEEIGYSVESSVLTVNLPSSGRSPIETIVEITLDKPVFEAYKNFNPDAFDAFAV